MLYIVWNPKIELFTIGSFSLLWYGVLFADKIEYFLVPSYSLSLSMIAFPIVAVSMHYLTGYYNVNIRRSRLAEFFSTIVSSFFSAIIIFFVMLIDDIVVSYTFYYRSFLILWALFFFFP